VIVMVDFKERLRQYKEQSAMAKRPEPPNPNNQNGAAEAIQAQPNPAIQEIANNAIEIKSVLDAISKPPAFVPITVDEKSVRVARPPVDDAMAQIPRDANITDEPVDAAQLTGGQRPSLGDVVHVDVGHYNGQYMAHVCFVYEDGVTVNLDAVNHHGNHTPLERVKYGIGFRTWCWPDRV
jgi:hypothetical protein